MKIFSRRDFNLTMGKGITATALLGGTSLACANSTNQNKKKLGIALVGLGSYSTYQLAPSLQDTEHCYLAGIVTGTTEKEKVWQDKYGVPVGNTYNYENFDSIAENDAIDIIYVVLPNSMHTDFSIRAAK